SVHRPGRWVRNVVFSGDGRSLFTAWTDDELWVCDAATGERQHLIKLEDPDRPDSRQSAMAMHRSADGKTLVAFSSYYAKAAGGPRYQETLVTGWDASTRRQLFDRRGPCMEFCFALSPDLRVLALPYPD